MDVDSTFIAAEQIDLLAGYAGSQQRVAAITERAMQGELDFAASLRERVATLAGLGVEAFDAARAEISFTPGALDLVAAFAERDWPVGLVSGGFHEIVDPLVADLPITRVLANRLEAVDGALTGRVDGPIVDRATKASFLRTLAADVGIALTDTIAIGDGANDLDMIRLAGMGVALHAKPAVAAEAKIRIDHGDLTALLYLQGYRQEEFVE